jgi:long-chain fatty acid transport protein
MTYQAMLRLAAVVVAAAALALLPATPALASGFQLIEQNASGLGNAYAGQAASVKDASAIYFNPAALTRLEGKNLVIGGNAIGIKTTFHNTASTRPSLGGQTFPVPQGGEGGDAGGWIPVPEIYFSWQAASQVWVGVGLNVPFGLETDWDPDWMGRFHATNSKIQTINVNPTIAVKLSDSISIGAGANWRHAKATLKSAVPYGGVSYFGAYSAVYSQVFAQTGNAAIANATATAAAGGIAAQLGSAGLAREGEAAIEGDSNAWGFNVGALLKLGEKGHLGVSYRSKVKSELDGTVEFGNAPTFSTSGAVGAIGASLNARFANGPVTAEVKWPDTFSAALSYEGDKVELMADYTWTGWSSIQSLDVLRADGSALSSVPLNFEDVYRVGLGANVKMNDKWTLRLGTAYDQAPVVEEFRTPRLPDTGRYWAAAGFQYRLSKNAAIDFGYGHIFFAESLSNLPNQAAPTDSPKGALIGEYKAQVNILSVQYRHSF